MEEAAVQEVPKTTLKVRDSEEGLTELRKAVVFTIIMRDDVLQQREEVLGQSPGTLRCDFPLVLSQRSHRTVLASPKNHVWESAQVTASQESSPGPWHPVFTGLCQHG